MEAISLAELEQAAELIYRYLPPTPQYAWPLLGERAGCELWVKHENHTPVGSFKVRGGIVFMDWLRRNHPEARGVVSAQAPTTALSFAAQQVIAQPATTRIADGVAISRANDDAIQILRRELERVVQVSDDQVEAAMRAYFTDTHNVAEGAGAAALA